MPTSQWEERPVAPVSMGRARRRNTLGGTFVVLGLLALLGAPLTLILVWSDSDALVAGVTVAAFVVGQDVLMLVANLGCAWSGRTDSRRT